ncbi:hypothetical protein BKA70DRAFT_71286 [Coprinopsis sp. MPI-PUGE-AT-0042]|nr:hypothetical protein BKA70DRAFT_71286 [Coprinopsis sp. MPI-PUGE-AT-0042]
MSVLGKYISPHPFSTRRNLSQPFPPTLSSTSLFNAPGILSETPTVIVSRVVNVITIWSIQNDDSLSRSKAFEDWYSFASVLLQRRIERAMVFLRVSQCGLPLAHYLTPTFRTQKHPLRHVQSSRRHKGPVSVKVKAAPLKQGSRTRGGDVKVIRSMQRDSGYWAPEEDRSGVNSRGICVAGTGGLIYSLPLERKIQVGPSPSW